MGKETNMIRLKIDGFEKIVGTTNGKYSITYVTDTIGSYWFTVTDNEFGRTYRIDLMKMGFKTDSGKKAWELRYSTNRFFVVSPQTIKDKDLLLSEMRMLIDTNTKPTYKQRW